MKTFLGIDISSPLSSKEFMRRVREAEALSPRRHVRKRAERAAIVCPALPAVTSVVYFVQAESGGPIKIGVTTELSKRLKALQTGHPEPLRLLHWERGGAEHEAYFHSRFADLRLSGEWFRDDGTLTAFIAAHASRPLDVT